MKIDERIPAEAAHALLDLSRDFLEAKYRLLRTSEDQRLIDSMSVLHLDAFTTLDILPKTFTYSGKDKMLDVYIQVNCINHSVARKLQVTSSIVYQGIQFNMGVTKNRHPLYDVTLRVKTKD